MKKTNTDYIELREGLIPDAVKYANKQCGRTNGKKSRDQWCDEWNFAFHSKMEELVQTALDQWIIGSDSCRAYLNIGSWKSAKRWIARYKAPLRYWIDGRPVFLKSEIDLFLKNNLKEQKPCKK